PIRPRWCRVPAPVAAHRPAGRTAAGEFMERTHGWTVPVVALTCALAATGCGDSGSSDGGPDGSRADAGDAGGMDAGDGGGGVDAGDGGGTDAGPPSAP